MHICFIEDTHLHGGTQIWVSEAIRHYLACGQDVTLLAPENSWIVEQCLNTNARIVTYDWDKVTTQTPKYQAIWANALQPCDVSICTVHPPRNKFHCVVFASKCIKENALKTHLIAKTGTIVPTYQREFYIPDNSNQFSVIAIAAFTKQYLTDIYQIPSNKVKLIYQGVDVQRFQSTPKGRTKSRMRYQLPKDAKPILGCIGSLEHRKGQSILFEAVAQLVLGEYPNIHLMVVGDGPDEADLKSLVKSMGIENHVSFFPFTKNPEFVYERVNIIVLPSIEKEGLPNVLLESMSMAVPVISSDLGGTPEVIINGKTGYLVSPGDSAQLSQTISTLWHNQSAYQEMCINASSFIRTGFNKKQQFSEFLDYFQKVKNNL